ncbi:MAG: hypothetical protein R3F25_04365 [Gammaproteobacteria bacterium]
MSNFKVMFLCLILFSSCGYAGKPKYKKLPFDQRAMYGGINRQEMPELKIADKQFIENVSNTFNGDLKMAAQYFVEVGFEYYYKDDLPNAMRRFNQAWLLDAENPEVYWGFMAALADAEYFCEAKKMSDIAISKGLSKNGFFADAGKIYTGCALTNKKLSRKVKKQYLTESEELFQKAYQQDEDKGYALTFWASSRFAQKDYKGAWDKVKQQRKVGGTAPTEKFLKKLKKKMKEPK